MPTLHTLSVWLAEPLSWLVVATFLAAGLVKGVVGLGLPTIAMGLLGSAMPPAQAAALLIVPSLATNLWQMLRGTALRALVRRLWALQAGIAVGTVWSPFSLANLDVRAASVGLGTALVVYAALGLKAARFAVPGRWERWASLAVGAVTGAITAATGVFVVPAVPYLQSLSLRKDELVQSLGLSFTVSTAALAWRLAADGMAAPGLEAGGWSWVVPLPAALIGMAIGQSLRSHLSEAAFKRVFFAGLLMLGLHMALRAVFF